MPVDDKVIRSFGEEWTRFRHGDAAAAGDLISAVDDYFHIFPWHELPADATGADIGCGSGRWAGFVAPRVGRLICIDGSAAAVEVARQNLGSAGNCEFRVALVTDLPLPPKSLDFAYCLGVLHHVTDTTAALKHIVSRLKPGAPFLLYLYYRLETRPWWYRALWHATRLPRAIISRTPFIVRNTISAVIAAMVYWPLARAARLAERLEFDVRGWPLTYYRSKRFYFMRCDALDRFGTLVEKRFTRDQIDSMMREAGLHRIEFSERNPYWTAVGRST